MNSDQSLICISKPAIAQRNRIDMNARARVASGDGEPSLKVAGVKGGQLFLEGHDDETSIGAHVGNLRVELDVLYLKSKIKDIFSKICI